MTAAKAGKERNFTMTPKTNIPVGMDGEDGNTFSILILHVFVAFL